MHFFLQPVILISICNRANTSIDIVAGSLGITRQSFLIKLCKTITPSFFFFQASNTYTVNETSKTMAYIENWDPF